MELVKEVKELLIDTAKELTSVLGSLDTSERKRPQEEDGANLSGDCYKCRARRPFMARVSPCTPSDNSYNNS